PRGYAVYVKQSEYVAYTNPAGRVATGQLEPSATQEILEKSDNPEIFLWPNPVRDKLSVLVSTPQNEHVGLQLISINGLSLMQEEIRSNQITELDVTVFPRGLYVVRLAVGNLIRTEKIILE
ncbi:MAG: T9SS type A sorting domain-containing protein, partial [Flammeovirgaceae bacterium]